VSAAANNRAILPVPRMPQCTGPPEFAMLFHAACLHSPAATFAFHVSRARAAGGSTVPIATMPKREKPPSTGRVYSNNATAYIIVTTHSSMSTHEEKSQE
jgi:hypothetical protein